MSKNMPDHIEEYFAEKESSQNAITSRELFNASEEDIDLKTDLDSKEIALITTLKFNDSFLKTKGLKPIFLKYFYPYMRLKVSKERKSRGEFVNVSKKDNQEDILNTASNLKNITDSKK